VTSLYHENPEIRRVAQAMFHPARTARVAVVVSAANYDACLDFYRQYAVLKILWQDVDRGIAVFGGQLGERSLTLLRERDGKAPGLHHVGLEVADAEDLATQLWWLGGAGSKPSPKLAKMAGTASVFVIPTERHCSFMPVPTYRSMYSQVLGMTNFPISFEHRPYRGSQRINSVVIAIAALI